MQWLYAALLGYLVGSIPFGLLLAKAAGKGDIRQIGSGNIGATNVLRTGSKGLAAAVLLLDAGKGFAAVWFAAVLWQRADVLLDMAAAGLGALIGHCFPPWLRFKGGKGVATMLGVSFGLDWRIGLASALTWLVVALTTRRSSLGGMASAIAAPTTAVAVYLADSPRSWDDLGGFWIFTPTLALMAVLVAWRHRENIARLRSGTEPKIGRKS
jgi:glycerol-3-phosphate acyltransferase PlsY